MATVLSFAGASVLLFLAGATIVAFLTAGIVVPLTLLNEHLKSKRR